MHYITREIIVEADDYSKAEEKAKEELRLSLLPEELKEWEGWIEQEGTSWGLQYSIRACSQPREGEPSTIEGKKRFA